MFTYKHTVVPGKYGELIQASDEIPTGSDVSKEEDSDSEDGERLHLLEDLHWRMVADSGGADDGQSGERLVVVSVGGG